MPGVCVSAKPGLHCVTLKSVYLSVCLYIKSRGVCCAGSYLRAPALPECLLVPSLAGDVATGLHQPPLILMCPPSCDSYFTILASLM